MQAQSGNVYAELAEPGPHLADLREQPEASDSALPILYLLQMHVPGFEVAAPDPEVHGATADLVATPGPGLPKKPGTDPPGANVCPQGMDLDGHRSHRHRATVCVSQSPEVSGSGAERPRVSFHVGGMWRNGSRPKKSHGSTLPRSEAIERALNSLQEEVITTRRRPSVPEAPGLGNRGLSGTFNRTGRLRRLCKHWGASSSCQVWLGRLGVPTSRIMLGTLWLIERALVFFPGAL